MTSHDSTGADAFNFLHGAWSVRHRILKERLVGSDEWGEYEGYAVCAPVLTGVGNFDQIWLPHRKAMGATLRLFDEASGEWTIHWAASDAPRLDSPMVGAFHNGVGVFMGEDQFEGRPVEVRFVWDEITQDSARWAQALAPQGTKEWESNWVMRFRRTSAEAHSASTQSLFVKTSRQPVDGSVTTGIASTSSVLS
jgi:hypothetical protein